MPWGRFFLSSRLNNEEGLKMIEPIFLPYSQTTTKYNLSFWHTKSSFPSLFYIGILQYFSFSHHRSLGMLIFSNGVQMNAAGTYLPVTSDDLHLSKSYVQVINLIITFILPLFHNRSTPNNINLVAFYLDINYLVKTHCIMKFRTKPGITFCKY